jgi:hypothetical protein
MILGFALTEATESGSNCLQKIWPPNEGITFWKNSGVQIQFSGVVMRKHENAHPP